MVRYHGNWCGPNWTAGQDKPSSELTDADRNVPAIDALDQICKDHDINLHDHPEKARHHNRIFIARAKNLGIKGAVAALLVGIAGPSPSPTTQSTTSPMPRIRRRSNDETDRNVRPRTAEVDALGPIPSLEDILALPDPHDAEGDPMDEHREELISESAPNTTQGMEIDGGEPESAPMAARASAPGPGNTVSKETPISNYPSLSYGLQETHTTILPWTGWCSVTGLRQDFPRQLKLRMNAPYDMVIDTIQAVPGTVPTDGYEGFYNIPIKENTTFGTTTFPETMTTMERPAWRDYWAQLYEYYTVLGCEYKITIVNPTSHVGASAIVGKQFDSNSDAATTTGNVMPLTKLSEAMAFKNISWEVINYSRSEVANRNVGIIQGTHRPGQTKRNIVNDGDVKTWTATGSIPNLRDVLTLNFYRAPLAWHNGVGLNMQIELKYIVQFKDLRLQARYPNTVTTEQNITQILSNSQAATGSALQQWNAVV